MRKDYEILGIQEDADEKKIKRAYFKLIREYSPEKNPERFQEIRAAYERLLEEKDKPKHDFQLEFPEDDSFALSMFDQIQQLLEEGDYAKALLTAQEGIKYYQEAECFLYMYARCCMLEGKNGKGVKAYEKLVERFPDKLFYKSELAKAYHIRGYQRKAYAMFQTAYKEGEREIDFLNLYSHCCYDREKYQESVQILQELVDSVPAEKTNQMILELLEAYTGLFMNCMAEPYPVEDVAEKCCLFLEQIEDQLEGYEEQIVSVLLFVRLVASRNHGKKLKRLVDKLKELVSEVLPDNMPTEMLDVFQMMEDDRFSELMKLTVKAFMLLDDTAFPRDSFDEYACFMQMDAFLCQLEAWPKQRKELDLLKEEYPDLYECGIDVWDMVRRCIGENRQYMIEDVLAEYLRMEAKFQCGHYYELYPDRRCHIEQIQWDSQEEGTFVRKDRKIGRNEPCPCGSGKKYKNCCGKG